MRLRPLLVAAAISAASAGCSHARKVPPPAPLPVEQPRIALEAAKVESLGFTGLNLEFGCRIENGNPFPLSVLRVAYRFTLEGRAAASGVVTTPLGVGPATIAVPPAPPTGSLPAPPAPPAAPPALAPGLAALTLPVSIRFMDVPSFAPLLQLGREAAWVLAGEVTFSTPAGPVVVPLRQEGHLALPRAPRFRVERAVLRKASPKEIVVEVAVNVHNPNAFALPAGKLGYGLFMSDKEVARTDVVVGEPIEAGEEATVAVPLRISVLKAGAAAARLLLPFSSLDVAIRGQAVFDGVPVPLDLSSSLVPDL